MNLTSHPSCLGLPTHQRNAHLQERLQMRVGIPHRGGHLAFHAFNHEYPAMVSAAAFWHSATGIFRIPEATNLYELDLALDSAGFTAVQLWQRKGTQRGMAGVYPWSYSQYVELASLIGASVWFQPDLCCEPTVAQSQQAIDYRVDATATLLEGTLRVVWAWQNELAKDGTMSANAIANMIRPPVPVIQGWKVSDYLRSLDLMRAVWERWEPWVAPPALIGVGSVCRRSLAHPEHGLYAILRGLRDHLPPGSRLHLFGIKGTALTQLADLPWVASADSMAWDFGARMKAVKAGQSNSMAHRANEMTRWMQAAHQRLQQRSMLG